MGVEIYYAYEETPTDNPFTSDWVDLVRWAHGNTAQGSAGDPRLAYLSTNLETVLNARKRWMNPVSRGSFPNNNTGGAINNQRLHFYHVRQWRWFTYRVYQRTAQEISDDDAPPSPVIEYKQRVDDADWADVQLTADEGETAWLDLDNTPVKPGMIFKVIGCEYAFQLPTLPGSAQL